MLHRKTHRSLRILALTALLGIPCSNCDFGRTPKAPPVLVQPKTAAAKTPDFVYSLFSVDDVRKQAAIQTASTKIFTESGTGPNPPFTPPAESPKHVILYVIDALRADQLEIFGNSRDTSPGLVELAKSAVVFTHCYSYATWTLPSVRSILSDRYIATNVTAAQSGVLPEGTELLQEVLQRTGWTTALISESPFVEKRYGLTPGFDLLAPIYVIPRRMPGGPRQLMVNSNSLKAVMSQWTSIAEYTFMEKFRDQATFMYVQTLEAHEPYFAPPPFDTLKPIDGSMENMKAVKYDVGTRFADHSVSLLVAMLKDRGWYDDTLLIITADHGETLRAGEGEDRMGHGGCLCLAKNHVPLVVCWPRKIAGGRRIDENVSVLDLAPTILDFVGAPIPASYVGNSLRPLLDGKSENFNDRTLLLSGSHGGPQAGQRSVSLAGNKSELDEERAGKNLGLVKGDWFYVRFADHNTLYRAQAGDGLQKNAAPEAPDAATALSTELDSYLKVHPVSDTIPEQAVASPASPDDEAHRAALKDLGYL